MSEVERGHPILIEHGQLVTPPDPVIPFIEGDGSGVDIWRAARPVLDAAVEKAYQGQRSLVWKEVFAGEKALRLIGTTLPEDTLQAFRTFLVGIKGPLGTPVGGGMRSLNVALRKDLDLYVCLRPVRWLPGVPAPVRYPERVDMVVFRENTEDVYAGIEFDQGSEDSQTFKEFLRGRFPAEYARLRFPESSAIGLKPVSVEGSRRLVRAAVRWALENRRRSVTLVHKGNIMKFTEGGFRKWGYQVCEEEFGGEVYTALQWERTRAAQGEEAANCEREQALAEGKLLVKDIIADAMFEAALTRPQEFDVLATTNLNGDYLSDALAAQVGGLGMAPGANINFDTGIAVFEATHGTAPTLAGKDMVNPTSFILSGEMLLRYIGWHEAADLILRGVQGAIAARTLTADLCAQVEGARRVGTREFAQVIIAHMEV